MKKSDDIGRGESFIENMRSEEGRCWVVFHLELEDRLLCWETQTGSARNEGRRALMPGNGLMVGSEPCRTHQLTIAWHP
jgi:hypothetical protein